MPIPIPIHDRPGRVPLLCLLPARQRIVRHKQVEQDNGDNPSVLPHNAVMLGAKRRVLLPPCDVLERVVGEVRREVVLQPEEPDDGGEGDETGSEGRDGDEDRSERGANGEGGESEDSALECVDKRQRAGLVEV